MHPFSLIQTKIRNAQNADYRGAIVHYISSNDLCEFYFYFLLHMKYMYKNNKLLIIPFVEIMFAKNTEGIKISYLLF